MFTLIWKKSGSLRAELDQLKGLAGELKSKIVTAEAGAQQAVEHMLQELGSIKSMRDEMAKWVGE